MNASVHLSTEQISDLLAGAVPATEAMGLNAHLVTCAACQQVRDDVLDLIAWLEDEGAAPVAMPDDVAQSLDLALREASAARAASAVRRPDGRQPWKWLAGAAAAVAVVSLGVAGLRALPAAHDNTSTDDAGAASPPGSDRSNLQNEDSTSGSSNLPGKGGAPSFDLRDRSVQAAQVPAVARRLSVAGESMHGRSATPGALGCAEPLTGDLDAVIRFEGRRAVLSIDPRARLATVYDCATGTASLFGPVGY